MVYTLYWHGGLLSLPERVGLLFGSGWNLTRLSEILREGEPASSSAGSTEAGVTTGGSTGSTEAGFTTGGSTDSAVEDSEPFACGSAVIGLGPLAAVSRVSRCGSSSRVGKYVLLSCLADVTPVLLPDSSTCRFDPVGAWL